MFVFCSVDANANAKKKKDKFDIFKQQYEKDPKVDHLGILYSQGKGKTISKKSFGQWDKRYCLAKDMHLLGYKNYDSKKPALDMVLFGFDVSFVGQEGKRKNVFSLNHPNRGTELFSAESKEDADKWIEVCLFIGVTRGRRGSGSNKRLEITRPRVNTSEQTRQTDKYLRVFFSIHKKKQTRCVVECAVHERWDGTIHGTVLKGSCCSGRVLLDCSTLQCITVDLLIFC